MNTTNQPIKEEKIDIHKFLPHKYAYKRYSNLDFDSCIKSIEEEFPKNGLGFISKVDLADAFLKRIGVNVGVKCMLLGACNPKLASEMFMIDHDIGCLLPCQVCVYEDDKCGKKTCISVVDPDVRFEVILKQNPELKVNNHLEKIKEIIIKCLNKIN
eukprot:EC821391.1.p1 GENE.EC821391.1~~EC821391.1.p1  ORF type:complete len:157 (+),score=36.51 EC821391.1:52-522(+)